MANFDAVGFFSKDYVTKLSILDILEGPGNLRPHTHTHTHHSSLLWSCCHSCDVFFLFIYHVRLKSAALLLQACDSLASGRLHCRLGRQQGDPVLFRESPSTGYSVSEENGKLSPVAMITHV